MAAAAWMRWPTRSTPPDASAIEMFQQIGDWHDGGAAFNNLGNALTLMQRSDEATAAYRQAYKIFREIGDVHDESIALGNLLRTSTQA
ncbi:tetratricopeptide repeat protein [Spirillospora sp. CA-253888]